jgi:hypothetical protein
MLTVGRLLVYHRWQLIVYDKSGKHLVMQNPRAAGFQLVANYELDQSIVLSSGSALIELQRAIGGNIISPNIPDNAPPDSPRIVIKGKDTVISMAWSRIQISVNPPDHIKTNFENSISYLRKRAQLVYDHINIPTDIYQWSGLISQIEYPFDAVGIPAIKGIVPLFDSLTTIDRKSRDLAAFQLNVGFRERGFNRNFTIAGYDTRDINFQANIKPNEIIQINLDALPIIESGIGIQVDINTKPTAPDNQLDDDVTRLLDEQTITVSNLEEELNIRIENYA